jgi:hypothetical protein
LKRDFQYLGSKVIRLENDFESLTKEMGFSTSLYQSLFDAKQTFSDIQITYARNELLYEEMMAIQKKKKKKETMISRSLQSANSKSQAIDSFHRDFMSAFLKRSSFFAFCESQHSVENVVKKAQKCRVVETKGFDGLDWG